MNNKFGKSELSKAQWLADLKWAAQSPLMVCIDRYAPSQADFNDYRQPYSDERKTELRDNTELYVQCLATLTSRFLGPYFECLWSSIVCLSDHLTLVARGLQIHEAGKTLGEFDFLLKPKGSSKTNTITLLPEIIHQEVAVKFYLGLSDRDYSGNTSSVWLGPNQIDRLDLKLFNMLTRQIKLSQLEGVKTKLANLLCPEFNTNTVIKPEIVMKGYLFHPYRQTLPLPNYVNPLAATGHWLTYSELVFSELICSDQHDKQWIVLPKLCWLAPAIASEHNLLNSQQLITELRKEMATGKPQLIVRMGADVKHKGTHSKVAEIARYFIVSDQWLVQARNSIVDKPLKDVRKAIDQSC